MTSLDFQGAAAPLTNEGLGRAADHVGIDPVALWTVLTVETAGSGFLRDRRPRILFERHVFSKRTGARFDRSHPDISGPPGGYGAPGAHQYGRLRQAVGLDRLAAVESASWGLGQIMGYNAPAAGYADADAMAHAMAQGEDEQLLGMARFLRSSKLHGHLSRKDWTGFARGYNGPGYEANRYHEKLASAHARFARAGVPDLGIRATQLLLFYHGFDPGPIDGVTGQKTRDSVAAFTGRHGLGGMSAGDPELMAALLKLPAAGAA